MILILTNKWDITADLVIAELRSRGGVFLRINTEDLALGKATVHLPDFQIVISKNDRVYDLTDSVNVIWNRRPGNIFDYSSSIEKPSLAVQRFIHEQWFSWLESLQLLSGVTWINHPQVNDAMESKVRQLLLATRIGFQIPETLITNNPDDVRQFSAKYHDNLVAKALYSPLIEEPDQDFFIFTNEIKSSELKPDDDIRISPSIFQQSIRPKVDYRVTVIGGSVLPAQIIDDNNGDNVNIDWRTRKDGLNFRPCDLSPKIEEKCKDYLKASGLNFGAIDIVRHENDYFFLEINPNGEWGWLQQPHGLPIAKTLCDFMMSHD